MSTHSRPADAGLAAQEAAEKHLNACIEAEDALEEALIADDHDAALAVDSPACAPFDGCLTCVVREALYAAWPVFTADVVARLRASGFDEAADLIAADNRT